MNRFQKMLSLFLTLVLVCLTAAGTMPVIAAEYITDADKAKGSNYTQSKELAEALDKIFDGDVDIFKDAACSQEQEMKLGTRMSMDTQYYVKSKATGNKISGWQCYIYANGVYNQLFGEWIGHANGYAKSYTAIKGGGNSLSHEIMAKAEIRCGAYIRTTGNSDGSYSSNVGHSMIVLSYNENGITYLEGNADGKGMIRITTRTWNDFNSAILKGKNRYIAHISQPKVEIYNKLYPVCMHETYGKTGVCSNCSEPFLWEQTFRAERAGRYQITKQVNPSLATPYESAADKNLVLKSGKIVGITGTCRNAFGDVWYAYPGADGKEYYLPEQSVKYVEPMPVHVTCSDFSPVNQAVLARKSQPVMGTITANHSIKQIVAYLDGQQYATWNAPNQNIRTVSLRGTDVNQLLTFSTLKKGKHTITLTVQTYQYETPTTVLESVFYMEEKGVCQHTYKGKITKEATCIADGEKLDTCSLCGEQKRVVLPALGHSYKNGACTVCGSALQVTLSGMVESTFGENLPVVVLLRRDSKVVGQLTITGLKGMYFFQDLDAGYYTLEVHKEECVPWVTLIELTGDLVIRNQFLRRIGDVSGDDKVTVGDTARLYAHIRNTNIIEDLYSLQCADLSGDGLTNVGDVARLYNMIKR